MLCRQLQWSSLEIRRSFYNNEHMQIPTNPSESFKRRNAHLYSAGTPVPDTQQCELPKELEGHHTGEAQGSRRPTVCFTLCRVRLLDVDSKYSSVKDLLDSLVHAGFAKDDSEGSLTLIVNQKKVSHYKDEATIIEVWL